MILRAFHFILVFGIFISNCNLPGISRFPTEFFYFLRNTSDYKISGEILNQATNPVQFCSLSNANGSINNAEVNSILISCIDSDTSVSQTVFSLPSGEYPLAQNITITTSTPAANLYYTLNGSSSSCYYIRNRWSQ